MTKSVMSLVLLSVMCVVVPVQAVAPARTIPYVEPICNGDANVFFCEDFEGEDILNYPNTGGSAACDSRWRNPALAQADGTGEANHCWGSGGSYQVQTIPLSGFGSGNRVWRITKSQGYTDVVTGINTETGDGTISGWLKPAILGTGAREWYARIQVYFHPTHSWPADYDYKVFYALPRDFPDAPSAVYETGMTMHEDFWCGNSATGIPDIPMIRYSNNFQLFPSPKYDGFEPWCPPLPPGQAPDGVHAPRLVKDRWYTLEYHYKLSSSPTSNDGILELWVDGIKAYSTTRNTCAAGCPDMGFIYVLGFMNPRDPQTGYAEIDNVIISRRYIGPPGGTQPPPPDPDPDPMPPAAPTNVLVTQP